MQEQFEEIITGQVSDDACAVCFGGLGGNTDRCQLCTRKACKAHLRKKRQDKRGKFSPICDLCEDSYLFKANLRIDIKAEENMDMQLQILQIKQSELRMEQDQCRQKLQEIMDAREQKLSVLLKKSSKVDEVRQETIAKIISQEVNYTSMCKELDAIKVRQMGFREVDQDVETLDRASKDVAKELGKWESKTSELQKQKDRILQQFLDSLDTKVSKAANANEKCIIF